MKLPLSAFALAAVLLAGSSNAPIHAAPIVSTLNPGAMTASQFNSLFTPISAAPTLTASYQFMSTPVSGSVESQVFQGTGAATGLYAYAYQIAVRAVSDTAGEPTSVNSVSFQFNASPIATNLINNSSASYSAYVVDAGKVGGIDAPKAGSGGSIQAPGAITLLGGVSSKSLTFQFLNPNTGAGALQAGARSATIVIISKIPFTTTAVSIQNANPQITFPVAYTPSVNVPEPSTILGWGGAIVGMAFMARVRKRSAARA